MSYVSSNSFSCLFSILLLKLSLFCHCLNFSLIIMHLFVQFFLLCCTLGIILKSFTSQWLHFLGPYVPFSHSSVCCLFVIIISLCMFLFFCMTLYGFLFLFCEICSDFTCGVFFLRVCLCISGMQCSRKPEDYIRSPWNWVLGALRILWKSSMCSQVLSHLSTVSCLSYGFSVCYILDKLKSILFVRGHC